LDQVCDVVVVVVDAVVVKHFTILLDHKFLVNVSVLSPTFI